VLFVPLLQNEEAEELMRHVEQEEEEAATKICIRVKESPPQNPKLAHLADIV
jgi:hypothetical protein